MYNTLIEMLDVISKEELLKYSKVLADKSPEEIKELLKSFNIEVSDQAASECHEYFNTSNALSDEELENVTGGGCTSTYSSETYSSLGLAPCTEEYQQLWTNHPLITTALNSCKLIKDGSVCAGCAWMVKQSMSAVTYCAARSQENDTGRS